MAMPCGVHAGLALDEDAAWALRQAMLFEAGKFDPQHAEGSALAPYALVIDAAAWTELAQRAETIAAELLVAEEALLADVSCWRALGTPRSFRRGLRAARRAGRRAAKRSGRDVRERDGEAMPAGPSGPRVIRFDFHPTTSGWMLSEANTDVPGGFLESAWLPRLLLATHRDSSLASPGDPGAALVDAIEKATVAPGCETARADGREAGTTASVPVVALIHATAFVDDASPPTT